MAVTLTKFLPFKVTTFCVFTNSEMSNMLIAERHDSSEDPGEPCVLEGLDAKHLIRALFRLQIVTAPATPPCYSNRKLL